MRALHLDFQRQVSPVPMLGTILLVCALAVTGQMARQYSYLAKVLVGWEEQAERVDRYSGRRGASMSNRAEEVEQRKREIKQVNELLRKITVPWGRLFQAVESAAPENVALLSMQPNADQQNLKIMGEAKNVDAMFSYVRTLESRDLFLSVALQSHEIQMDDAQRPIRFSLVAVWKEQP